MKSHYVRNSKKANRAKAKMKKKKKRRKTEMQKNENHSGIYCNKSLEVGEFMEVEYVKITVLFAVTATVVCYY